MQRTNIEWTDYSSNPIKYRRKLDNKIVWACVKVSPGCTNCYAAALEKRFHGGRFAAQDIDKVEPFIDLAEMEAYVSYSGPPAKVFIGDMTDIFGEWIPDGMLDELFAAIGASEDSGSGLTFQILTKRAERMHRYMTERAYRSWNSRRLGSEAWPARNIWLGVSAENQPYADGRIHFLLHVPAVVHFVSYEPALGPIDFSAWLDRPYSRSLDWAIIGGESGPGSRRFQVQWARDAVEGFRQARIPCFVKQMGAHVVDRNDMFSLPEDDAYWPDDLDFTKVEHDINGFREEYQGADCRIRLLDKKGGKPKEWPPMLRIREFPATANDPSQGILL